MAEIRLARSEEADAIRALVRAAYAIYVLRIGREPSPMNDDYPDSMGFVPGPGCAGNVDRVCRGPRGPGGQGSRV